MQLHDTPADYFSEYMNAAKASLEKNAAKNAFFKEVWDSQKAFAEIAVPFWAGAADLERQSRPGVRQVAAVERMPDE